MLNLKWAEVDLDRRTARLADTKTGASMRPLSMRACAILRAMPEGEFVFQAMSGDVPNIHSADAVLLDAADKVADEIERRMRAETA